MRINQKKDDNDNDPSTTVIRYHPESIDATNVPNDLDTSIRTLFGSFHHFKPNLARKILQDAVIKNHTIAIFEGSQRSLLAFFTFAILMPLIAMMHSFWIIKPKSVSHVLSMLFVSTVFGLSTALPHQLGTTADPC
jgi:hypothetical protein